MKCCLWNVAFALVFATAFGCSNYQPQPPDSSGTPAVSQDTAQASQDTADSGSTPACPFSSASETATAPTAGVDSNPPASCAFKNLSIPKNAKVFAAGSYGGRELSRQIDQSGHEATQIDVAVNFPNAPVILMLGAYEPTIWSIGWSKSTKILAVLISGYHRQVVAGLPSGTPRLISTYDNSGPCDFFYVEQSELSKLNPISRKLFGRPVEKVFIARDGVAVLGKAIPGGMEIATSSEITPESFFDQNAPIAGPAGLADAERKGLIRAAGEKDFAAWSEAVTKRRKQQNADVPPVDGQDPEAASGYHTSGLPAYVVLKAFTFPAGLYGANSATFFVPPGVPAPQGNPGHSEVLDLAHGTCLGDSPICHAE